MSNVSKKDLVAAVAGRLSLSRAVVESVLDATLAQIGAEADAGNAVQIKGFGTFKVKAVTARMVLNPRTRESVEAEAYTQLVLKAPKKAVV